ncbi:MAG: hypothetical protein E7077_09045 [Bacteroidales bacterium]|jgi:hypothetical protein|nr:hypothetical protein [Bacteroidales bacterium]
MEIKKGDWVLYDDKISQIIDVYSINYEKFDSEVKVDETNYGKLKCKYFLIRDLCTIEGKLVSGKPYIVFIESFFETLEEEDLQVLEKIKKEKKEKYAEWESKEVNAKTKEVELYFSVEVKPKEGANILKHFKKICKQLPSLFSFAELVEKASQLDIDMTTCVDDYQAYDNQISFTLKFNLDDIKDGVVYYHKVCEFDYTDAEEDANLLENFFTYESLFISIVLFLNRYTSEETDETAQTFKADMKTAASALMNKKLKNSELAKLYYDFVPKKTFTKEESFDLFKQFIDMNKQNYNLEKLCQTIEEKHDWSVEVYNLSYDYAKEMFSLV